MHIFLLVVRVEKCLHNDNSTRGIKHVDCLIVFIASFDLDCGVHFRSGSSSNEERNVNSSLSELFCIENHLVKRRGDQSRKSHNVSLFLLAALNNLTDLAHNS